MLSKVISFLFLSVFILSCNVDTHVERQQVQFPGVDEALWPHFEAFQEEGRKRGVSIDLANANISGEISSISEEGVAGTCQYGSHITNHVTIDENYWSRASSYGREYVVFHELGHCFLLRDHNDRQDDGGICLSVMHSGLTQCRSLYNIEYRAYYLDELFSEINTSL